MNDRLELPIIYYILLLIIRLACLETKSLI